MEIDYSYLNNENTKPLMNIIKFINNPEQVKKENNLKSIAKKLCDIKYRYSAIEKNIERLNTLQMNKLINDIKHNDKIINEFCNALLNKKVIFCKQNSSINFLIILIKNIDDNNKFLVFQTIFHLDSYSSMDILLKETNENIKNEYIKYSIDKNAELAFIFLFDDGYENYFENKNLDTEKLIEVLINKQQLSPNGILNKYKRKESLFKNIIISLNAGIESKDYSKLYFISMNKEFFNELINVNNDLTPTLDSIKDFIGISNANYEGTQLENVISNYTKQYTIHQIIVNLNNTRYIMNFNEKILIKILSNFNKLIPLYKSEDKILIKEFVLKNIKIFLDHEKVMGLNIIKNFKITNKDIEILLEIYNKKKMNSNVNCKIIETISQNIFSTKENEIINNLLFSAEADNSHLQNNNTVIFATCLTTLVIDKVIKVLNKIKKLDEAFYDKIFCDLEYICIITDYEQKLLNLFCLDDFISRDKLIRKQVSNYKESNKREYEKLIEKYDHNKYISQIEKDLYEYVKDDDYINLKKRLSNYENRDYFNDILQTIANEILEENKLQLMLKLYKDNIFSVSMQMNYRGKFKNAILRNKELLYEEIIELIIDTNFDDLEIYLASNDNMRNIFLKHWSNKGKTGKIIDIMRNVYIKDIKDVDDIRKIQNIINEYQINDKKINLELQIKCYNIIEEKIINLKPNDNDLNNKILELINLAEEFDIEERLIDDIFLLSKLDSDIEKKIYKLLLENSTSEKILIKYWSKIDRLIEEKKDYEIIKQLNVFIPCIIKDSKRIDWFLNMLDENDYDIKIMVLIQEVSLDFIRNKNLALNQLNTQILNIKMSTNGQIANSLKDSLTSLEKTIIRIENNNPDRDILINNLKELRKDLDEIGISTVESLNNYGQVVNFDIEKHEHMRNIISSGIIESLGIKVGNTKYKLSCIKNNGDEINE